MSFLPFLIDLERPRRRQDQNFSSLKFTPEDLLTVFHSVRPGHDLNLNYKHVATIIPEGQSTIKNDAGKYQINLDVQHFTPDEISVKTADGFIIIEASHEDRKDDHGYVSRKFTRRYQLPEKYNIEAVESKLSSDGVLTVTAPLVKPASNERVVTIVRTGPVKTQPEPLKQEVGEDPMEPADELAEDGQ